MTRTKRVVADALCMALLFAVLPAFAAEERAPIEATTVNGDKVLLYPNGRWEYVNQQK